MGWLARRKDPAIRQMPRAVLGAVTAAGRFAGQAVHRVADQGLTRARMAGAQLARHIISVQTAAGLNPKLMEASARSVEARQMNRPSDMQWQAGYAAEAWRLLTPPAPRPERSAARELEAGS